ncbi:ANKRD12 family protein [Megaselia abdita]
MSSTSNTKDEVAVSIKDKIKPEEGQQSSTLMNTKDGSDKSQSGSPSPQNTQQQSGTKRAFAEVENTEDSSLNTTESDETKRKKRKDGNTSGAEVTKDKEVKTTGIANKSIAPQKSLKQTAGAGQSSGASKGNGGSLASAPSSVDGKSPCGSPKTALGGSTDGEADDIKEVPKVPPLKIVIPSSIDNDNNGHGGNNRNGKNSSARNASLPYVVTSSNSNDAIEKSDSTSRCNSPADSTKGTTDDKLSTVKSEEGGICGRGQQRVLRSSNRNAERSSNNSSPQMQGNNSSSVSPAPKEEEVSKLIETSNAKTSSPANNSTDDSNTTNATSTTNVPSPSTVTTTSTSTTTTTSNELHPRKRKIKQKQEENTSTKTTTANQANETVTTSTTTTADHPHDHPFTNCYQMFMNIRKQIEQKHKNILPIQPKPPQGFDDYLMNRKTYLLASRAPAEDIQIPSDIVVNEMKELYTTQERERVKLKLRHIVEKEKLGLCVEQEILRVHAKAARSLANQSVPYSACTMLKDEEIYNVITPEQEEKDRHARSRYNGRLFLGWLQDVDDKWEKIKEAMILRHHNEAESLNAVQRMDWEFALVEHGLHGFKIHPHIKDEHVPIVPVSDEFDLLPA